MKRSLCSTMLKTIRSTSSSVYHSYCCLYTRTHAHAHTHTILSGNTSWVNWYQKKHSPTHTYPDQSTVIHGILPVQFTFLTVFCATCVQVFIGLTLCLALSTSYSIHFFTQSLSSFCSTYPYHRNLFCCSTEIISSNPSLSRSQFFTWNLYLLP